MYRQAADIASFDLPLRFLPSWTILKSALVRSVMVRGRLSRSHMLEMVRKELIRVRSELLTVRRLLKMIKKYSVTRN